MLALGGGRQHRDERVLQDVGVEIEAKAGDRVLAGQPLATVYGRRDADRVRRIVTHAFAVTPVS